MRSRACGDSEREKGVCESVVTEDKLDSRLAAHRGPVLAQAPEAPTVLGSATLSPLSDAYMFMYPSSFQLLYGRSPPSARRHHRLFDSGPPIDPRTPPPTPAHQVSWQISPAVRPSASHALRQLFDSGPPIDPRTPPTPAPQASRMVTVWYTPSPGRGAAFQPEQVRRENEHGEWLA